MSAKKSHSENKKKAFGRYTELMLDEMTTEQRNSYDYVMQERLFIPGPFKIWLDNPDMMNLMRPVGSYFSKGKSSLTAAEREIAIALVNGKWLSAYVNRHHEKIGLEAGLQSEKIDSLIAGLPVSFDQPRQQMIYEITAALINPRNITEGLFKRAVEIIGNKGLTDLILLVGYYTSVSLTLNLYNVPADAEGLKR